MKRRPALPLLALLLSGTAGAYPHFQLTSGSATCFSCHHAPAGGGQLDDYGREESAELSTFGGDGGVLHGLLELPRWLSLGGELRLAGLVHDDGSTEGTRIAAFPMQVDLSARLALGRISATVVGSLRGAARPEQGQDDSNLPPPPLFSREHFVTWQATSSLYLRAGRFMPPYGLRIADHTAYIRRTLDLGLEQEPYGLSGGAVHEDWEVHATAFALDPLRSGGPRQLGGAALAELRIGSGLLAGGSTRVSVSATGARRIAGGLFGKLWHRGTRLLWMAELDLVHQRFDGRLPSRWQLVAYAGPVWRPARGLYAGLVYESHGEDLRVPAAWRHAAAGWVSFLPWSHVEVMISGRAQLIGTADRAWNLLTQLHYYL